MPLPLLQFSQNSSRPRKLTFGVKQVILIAKNARLRFSIFYFLYGVGQMEADSRYAKSTIDFYTKAALTVTAGTAFQLQKDVLNAS